MKFIHTFRNVAAGLGGILVLAATLILGGQSDVESYLTHISTDKPVYHTGERLYARGVFLRANGHSPMAGSQAAAFTIKGPKGDTVVSGNSTVIDSVMGFGWDIPSNQAGGEYTIHIVSPLGLPAERKFEIRAYRAPRLKSQIAFVRDGYGPGNTVAASLHVERAEGGKPTGARVSISARIDGEEAWKGTATVDSAGNASADFKLPAEIARGEGVLAMTIQDGGNIETTTKTIPILLRTLDLAFYPEGGDLVAGLPNRVYFEGRTPAQKPADTEGFVSDSSGRQVATLRSEHEGRGRFTFVPVKGETYSFHVTMPAGIQTVFTLPAVKDDGVVLSSAADVMPAKKNLNLRIASTEDRTYDVEIAQHGKELAFESVALRANQPTDVSFTLPRTIDGVMVATVYDEKKTPVAERLIFRQPEHQLNVKVVTDRNSYVPGDKVHLSVTTTDDSGKPVSAVVGLTVTDSSVLEMIEKREQAPRLPVMVFFESEVRDLADAHVYLDGSNAKAPLATDLLLGTQGWRRFATADIGTFVSTFNDAARRALGNRPLAGLPMGNASLTGLAIDSTRALIPGVSVTATNVLTGVATTVLTNESGSYNFVTLPAGPYMLKAELTGFLTSATGLDLTNTENRRLNFEMHIGTAGTMVDVSVNAEPILAQSAASVGQVLSAERIRDLPLVGNNVLDLLNVLPGTKQAKSAGNAANKTNTTRDGIAVTDTRVQNGAAAAVGATTINPDRVGEVRWIQAPTGPSGRPFAGPATAVVREFAHALRPSWTEGSRDDFSETIYWNAGVKTDAVTGMASVSFNLSDSVTSFRVLADAFDMNGTLGSGTGEIESVQPLSIEPKLPLQITGGDVIQLPIGITNATHRELGRATIMAKAPSGLTVTLDDNAPGILRPDERSRRFVQIDAARNFSGMANLTFDATAGNYRDSVSRKLDVQPLGFPYELDKGGVLDANSSQSMEFTFPAETVPGSASATVTVYPSPLASMTDALKALLQQPYGCFEQTSSTSYPMVMAQQYFVTHRGVEPETINKTKELLDVSYKRLTGFESRSRGYEWFGGDPGHEALTAYGLMQFTDMARVRNVDKDMLERTRAWLLSRRDGKGGFLRDSRSHGSGIGSALTDTTNAYITWALVESGETRLEKEIAAVRTLANSTDDSYIVALGANILHASGDRNGALQLMSKLANAQDASGYVKGGRMSITQSGGNSLAIEVTSLSALAWMTEPDYASNVEKGLKWIAETNKNGRFGSTQSTILALRTIVAYDEMHARPKVPGRVLLMLDGKKVGAPVSFDANMQGVLTLPDLANAPGPGKHTLVLKMEDGASMPFSMSVKFHSTLPDSSEQARIGIQVALKDRQIQEGGVTEAVVSIVNKSDQAIPTPVAIVGIPGGLEVRHEQLKELVKSGRIDAYEVMGREVVLYWRSLKANDKFDLPLSLVAAIPGSYSGPASRAYLYYTDEYKSWAPELKVNITPQ
jgi:hypothetical protein